MLICSILTSFGLGGIEGFESLSVEEEEWEEGDVVEEDDGEEAGEEVEDEEVDVVGEMGGGVGKSLSVEWWEVLGDTVWEVLSLSGSSVSVEVFERSEEELGSWCRGQV